jgi:hypothetical protein
MAAGLETLVLTGIAEILAAARVGSWDASHAPAVDTDVPVITRGRLPSKPDRAIALADYPVASDAWLGDCIIGVQVRVRGTTAPDVARDLMSACNAALAGLTHVMLAADVWASQIVWNSGTDLGPDEAGRHERVANWYVHTARSGARLDG